MSADTSDLASKANGLGAWARKLNDAIEVINGAHALQGELGSAKQALDAIKAETEQTEKHDLVSRLKLEDELAILRWQRTILIMELDRHTGGGWSEDDRRCSAARVLRELI